MTEVTTETGEVLQTNLPAEKVADLQAKPAETTPEPAKPEAPPASQTIEEQPPKAEAGTEPQAPTEPVKREKPKPIAKLLEDRHNLQEENARLKADLEKATQATTPTTPADVKALAETYGLEEKFVSDLLATLKASVQPELPKEVQDLIAKQKLQQQVEVEEKAFKTDLGRLEATLKDDMLKDPKVQEKLKELAYSDQKAPDGELYHQKPLYELYMNYVKPEIEPGKASAEPARGGSKASGKIVDFAKIASDPQALSEFARTATTEQFDKFHTWQLENQKEPLMKPML